ncbi:MAG TPA: tetratricopeptide repeat protein [Edaphobacter sp.]|nr:tetratricopeptide repeat protein [Edaphobacter sp.]
MTMLSRFHRKNSCVQFWTLALTLTFAFPGYAQTQQNSAVTLADRIAQDRQTIQQAEQQHRSDEMIGYLWAVLASEYRKAGDFAASEDAYFKAIPLLDHSPTAARNYATALDNLAVLYLIYGRVDEAEQYNRRSAKVRSGLGFPLDQARSEEHMAEINLARHKFKVAAEEATRALEVMTRLDDPEKRDVASALNALAFSHCSQKDCAQGMEYAQRSLNLTRSSFGEESAPVAHSLMAVGFAEWKLGRLNNAGETMRSAIQMLRIQEGGESRGMLLAMLEYRNYLKGVHRDSEAKDIDQELALAMRQQTPVCATCVNVHTLSNAMR